MALLRILIFVCAAAVFVDAKSYRKRETTANVLCEPAYSTNNTLKVHCYCVKDGLEVVHTADCYTTSDDISPNDQSWQAFDNLKDINRLTLTNTRGITLKYIPTNALKYTASLIKLDVKYGNIQKIQKFAFANLSSLEEISLRDNQIEILEAKAFAHHRELTTINLDKNNLVEINRDVFIDLPALEKLFLTTNKITTIHDRAFVHLSNLRELEIDSNSLFSLNSETFSGLKKLQKLDLSSNSLEVIGDNTFLPLINLRSLNLEGNKIQMLDDKAFNGLSKVQSLSLAHNKLVNIDNVGVFEGLEALVSLSLRENMIRELKTEVIAPILNNFYSDVSSLDVEDNNFPCDCRLDWFMSLMNKTRNNHLRLSIENLKCNPDAKLREMWLKTEETDKNTGQVFEDEDSQVQNNDYEYYDDTQLNGKLFYIDIRDLLNCTNTIHRVVPEFISGVTTTKTSIVTKATTETPNTNTTKEPSSPGILEVTLKTTTALVTPKVVTEHKSTKVTNQGLLDLSLEDTTVKPTEATTKAKINEEGLEKKLTPHTTTRLATVSAKPIDKKDIYEDHDMASDEAKPDKIKAHRSIQEEIKNPSDFKMNNAQRNVGCAAILIPMMLCFRLTF